MDDSEDDLDFDDFQPQYTREQALDVAREAEWWAREHQEHWQDALVARPTFHRLYYRDLAKQGVQHAFDHVVAAERAYAKNLDPLLPPGQAFWEWKLKKDIQ